MSIFDNHRIEVKKFIEEAVSKYESAVEKERSFLKWILENVFERTEADFFIVNASNEVGFDAFFEIDMEEVGVIRSRYGASHTMKAINQFDKDFSNFKSIGVEKLDAKLRILKNWINEGRDVNLMYFTNNKVSEDERHNAFKLGIKVFDIDKITYEIWCRNAECNEAVDFTG